MIALSNILQQIETWVWSMPMLMIIFGVGIYLTCVLKGVQFRYFFYSMKLAFEKDEKQAKGDISNFQALMTALAGTIGIGGITGVATAIAIGGLGSLFWMWVTAFVSMATKYAEGLLGMKYRIEDKKGQMSGGPMYYLEKGLKSKKMAIAFALFGSLAAFGMGNIVQANSIALAVSSIFPITPIWIGIVLALLTALSILKGIKSIGAVSSYLVPIMGLFYLIGGIIVISMKWMLIPDVLHQIFIRAFIPKAAIGGIFGSSIMLVIQMGVSRGIFSSEAGIGTGPIAAAAAKTDVLAKQALISMSGVFLTTIICMITGLVIALSGVVGQIGSDGMILNGSALAVASFESFFRGGGIFVAVSIILFGFSTILGWAYCGEKCVEYIFGLSVSKYFKIIFIFCVVLGSALSLQMVWSIANITSALMSIPNLLGLFLLAKVVVRETNSFDVLLSKQNKLIKE